MCHLSSLTNWVSLPQTNKGYIKLMKCKTMVLLRVVLYRRLWPPGAHSGSSPPLYMSRVMPAALGFIEIEGEMPFFSPPLPLTSSNKISAQVGFSSFISSKYLIALNHPSSCCHFCLVDNMSTFVSDNFSLFLLSVTSTWASTSGWVLREPAFSHAIAWTRGFWTVQKHQCCCIPHWCRRSTQSSILSPTPPGIYFICHSTCLNIVCTLGVMGGIWGLHCSARLPIQTFGKSLCHHVLD